MLTGILRTRTPRTLTLQPVGDPITLETSDVPSEETSNLSLMPEGRLETLDESQVRNLIRYLMSAEPR